MIFNIKQNVENKKIADYIIEEYGQYINLTNWRVTKWENGRAECYTPDFKESGNLTMTAIGNIYYSNNLTLTLPTGLFIDNSYIALHEIQSTGSPISIIRQSTSTKDSYIYKVNKANNTKTGVSFKVKIIGRWK